MLKAIASHGDTMAVFVGLKELPTLVPLLEKYYPDTTPVSIVFKAGYSQYQQLVHTDLKGAAKAAHSNREKFLGLIYIGNRLGNDVRPPRQSDKDPL
jgi:precorrin-4 methylase